MLVRIPSEMLVVCCWRYPSPTQPDLACGYSPCLIAVICLLVDFSLVALACYFVWVCWLACGLVRRLFCFKSIRALTLSPEFQSWSSKMNARVHCANRKLFGRVVLIILPAPQ